jgi:hypothetical protein
LKKNFHFIFLPSANEPLSIPLAMFAKFVELYIITVLVNYTGVKYYEIYRI